MLFAERDRVIKELSANRPVEPFTMSIGKRGSGRNLDHFHAHTLDRPIAQARAGPATAGQPWHFLYFLPLPHQQGSLRPGLGKARRFSCSPDT